ncbi:remorin [Panicum miliaceum]|uniref:Remorin n=1 Tax=Panicum miliaceum TaxID=4540 RepID=A0A3L6PD54_PANMI|nr:remorin [Panicum miliaceum]
MDGDMKHLRVRFSGVRQEDHGGGDTIPVPSQECISFARGLMSNAEEYDAAYAATVAAVAYAIAAREEERLASQEKPIAEKLGTEGKPMAEKVASGENPALLGESRSTPQSKSPPKRGESFKRPIEGSRSPKWFSGKEPIDDACHDEPGANVSVRRPLRPAQKKPEAVISSDEKVADKFLNGSAPSKKKEASFARKGPEKNGSRKFEQDEGNQMLPPTADATAKPMSSYSGRKNRVVATPGMAFSSEAEAVADAWEKEKLAKIKQQYNETMDTITEWEAEKKAKARRQKELRDESDSERKRAKALEEYNEEMSRINKVAIASKLTAEEKRRNAERKVRDKRNIKRRCGRFFTELIRCFCKPSRGSETTPNGCGQGRIPLKIKSYEHRTTLELQKDPFGSLAPGGLTEAEPGTFLPSGARYFKK